MGTAFSSLCRSRVALGTGNATVDFKWDGKNVSGAVCGDMQVTRERLRQRQAGRVPGRGRASSSPRPRGEILASPRFPVVKVNLKVAALPGVLGGRADDPRRRRTGVCGYVVDKVDIRGVLEGLIDKGFNVRLPTEKIKPMAIPVGIEPDHEGAGRAVRIAVTVSDLAITEHMIWLGADVKLADVTGHDSAGSTPEEPKTRGE